MANKEQRQNKQFVEKLLLIQGKNYDEWLDQIHLSYIQENNQIIFEALESKLNKPNGNSSTSQSLNTSHEANTETSETTINNLG